ncbi:MAG TPA: aminotransferase class III-fold pyridoxal phosphate-dependent enzyme [Steroidobacteraceae bacterium]|nr:aminotransferase class III-fold pyridoxal phosphate-dependent enzyme [Steroidobacteraceae bacterium]
MSEGIQRYWTGPSGTRPPLIDHAQGMHIWDRSGKRYIDVTSGPIAVNIGHGNARVLEAMRKQAARVCFAYPSNFESADSTELSARLAKLAGPGLDCAFFVSSGSEAVEKCLQFARRAAIAVGQPGRYKVISRNPSYHGSTRAMMALSADPAYAPYLTGWPGGLHVNAPLSYRPPEGMRPAEHARQCAEELRTRIITEDPALVLAFIMEPVMGFCGGAASAPPEYYRRVREICNEFGVLLVYDEIVSGAGRAGTFLAAEQWPGARPDLAILAKGLGGGYVPLAAFLAPARLVDAVAGAGGFHVGHTHKAHPLACAVGLAVLAETTEQRLIERARDTGGYLRSQLEQLQQGSLIVGDVRGLGMLNAIEIVADRPTKRMLPRELDVVGRIQALGREQGLLIYGRRTHAGRFGDWIMVAPPLIATHADVDEIVAALGRCLSDYQKELATQP